MNPRLIPLACAPVLAGCHGSAGIFFEVPEPDPVYAESEPNDDAWNADWMGALEAGDALCIVGDVRDDFWDPQDGFALQALEPIEVEFELVPGCGCADLDLWVYDPALDEFVLVFDSPYAAEKGAFTVWNPGMEFHLVVVSFDGDAAYELRLWVRPAQGFLASSSGGGANALSSPAGRAAEPVLPGQLGTYPRGAHAGETGPLQVFEVLRIDPATGRVESALLVPGARGVALLSPQDLRSP